jgi:hypothetical protein
VSELGDVLEQRGQTLLVHEAEPRSGSARQARVRVVRDGTQVTLHSSDLGVQALSRLVVPAPTEPPPLAEEG